MIIQLTKLMVLFQQIIRLMIIQLTKQLYHQIAQVISILPTKIKLTNNRIPPIQIVQTQQIILQVLNKTNLFHQTQIKLLQ
jgi:hypothetical protein